MDGDSTTQQLLRGHLKGEDSLTQELLRKDRNSSTTEYLLNQPLNELLNIHTPLQDKDESDLVRLLTPISFENDNTSFHSKNITDEYIPILRSPISINSNKFGFEQRQIYNVLNDLFHNIRMLLYHNGYSQFFLKIFKTYVTNLFLDNKNPLNDPIVVILQNEINPNFKMTENLNIVIMKFLINSSNDKSIKLSFFQSNRDDKLLDTVLKKWLLKTKIKTIQLKKLQIFNRLHLTKYLKVWFDVYNNKVVDLNMDSNEFNEFRLISKNFDRIALNYNSIISMELLADNTFLSKFFSRLSNKSRLLKDSLKSFHHKNNNSLIKMALAKKWKLQYILSKKNLDSPFLKKRYFEKLRSHYQQTLLNNERSQIANRIFVLQSTLHKWEKKTKAINSNLIELRKLQKHFTLKRYLIIWKRSSNDSILEKNACARLDNILLKFIFSQIWYKRFNERFHFLYSVSEIKNDKTKQWFLNIWKKKLFLNLNSIEFRNTTLVKSHFKKIVLYFHLRKFQNYQGHKTFSKVLHQNWHNEFKVLQFKKQILSKRYLAKWQTKYDNIRRLQQIAAQYRDQNSEFKVFFNQLKIKYHDIENLKLKSLIFEQLKAIKTIRRGISHILAVNDLYKQNQPLQLAKREYSFKYLHLWMEKVQNHNIQKLNTHLLLYEKKKVKRLKSKYWHSFRSKFNFCHDILNDASRDFEKIKLNKVIFNTMITKYTQYKVDLREGADLNRLTTSQKMFSMWIEKLNRKSELELELRNFQDSVNFHIVSNNLKIWTMKLLKLQTNNEKAHSIRKRWQRATLRGILNLWKLKSETKQTSLQTPHRPITPNSSDDVTTIPGSTAVRRTRMEAMMSHYSKARRRAIPSPLKSSNALDTTVKRKLNSVEGNFKPLRLDFGNLEALKPSNDRPARSRREVTLTGSPTSRRSFATTPNVI
ncbi:hypothetical protein KAFR_0C06360 [Kazachstania africana CBS 2517]|uniref:Sfi1 spindle body domain-containing protein n=1 Tax=Kazachstania africana (strain ATCC 22294 / BCRC 22015 / CBS 2517 / CECT 1963 / NBRC 1671 / NRRL Y-8276) TaxID=1071382 RepID=H2ATD2_KAZAF|nr:hypothetical protein KAFR_0C06360 [Kazachstania africana CBS 2517]CCF57632.1 hypothetical protein KAFR_0C06360 [Kazachstania africana CBS 2517]